LKVLEKQKNRRFGAFSTRRKWKQRM